MKYLVNTLVAAVSFLVSIGSLWLSFEAYRHTVERSELEDAQLISNILATDQLLEIDGEALNINDLNRDSLSDHVIKDFPRIQSKPLLLRQKAFKDYYSHNKESIEVKTHRCKLPKECDFYSLDVSYLDLSGMHTWPNLNCVSLTGVGTYFNNSSFINQPVYNANLKFANFNGAYTDRSGFRNSALTFSHFKGAKIERSGFCGSNLEASDFTGARFFEVQIQDSHVQEANFTNVLFDTVSFTGTDLFRAKFIHSTFRGDIDFNGAKNLNYAIFELHPDGCSTLTGISDKDILKKLGCLVE